jgi:hypothetical protein
MPAADFDTLGKRFGFCWKDFASIFPKIKDERKGMTLITYIQKETIRGVTNGKNGDQGYFI